MKAVEKLGIYGGTFSPIHCGHVNAALAFYRELSLDRLLVIPTAVPPHKAEVAGAEASDRLNMARIAFEDTEAYKNGGIEVSDYEISREGKSYTVYTLEHFSSPECELYFLMGTDMFLTLRRWFRAEDIFKLARIVLIRRECDREQSAEIENKAREYRECFAARIIELDEPPLVVSSTELRARIRDGQPTDGLIPNGVAHYIREKNLYR